MKFKIKNQTTKYLALQKIHGHYFIHSGTNTNAADPPVCTLQEYQSCAVSAMGM